MPELTIHLSQEVLDTLERMTDGEQELLDSMVNYVLVEYFKEGMLEDQSHE